MNLVNEDLWSTKYPCMLVVTTNGDINASGQLVMGRGAALQAKTKSPSIPTECADVIRIRATQSSKGRIYGFLEVRHLTEIKCAFGIFQVKYHWSDSANLDLIRHSCRKLNDWALKHADLPIRMNYPGIGNGRLKFEQVDPILKELLTAPNITICVR